MKGEPMRDNDFVSTAGGAPSFTIKEAQDIAARWYGLDADAAPLPSERDQNFLLTEKKGRRFVLKIANPQEKRAVLELQNKAFLHLKNRMSVGTCPALISSSAGYNIETVLDKQNKEYYVRLVTYIPGKVLADAKPHSSELLFHLGAFLADLNAALSDFSHPAAKRKLIWDLSQALPLIEKFKRQITQSSQRKLIEKLERRITAAFQEKTEGLSWGIIHNDGNDRNIIVSSPSLKSSSFGQMRITGLIDFGDMIYSYQLADLAVVCAYAMLNKQNPLQAACSITAGYHSRIPLRENELAVLYDLIQLRLMMSVCISAHQKKLNPENQYLSISEKSIWALLEDMRDISPDFIHYSLRSACGLPPCPRTAAVVDWLISQKREIGPLTRPDLRKTKRTVFDLSIGSPWLDSGGAGCSPIEVMRDKIANWRRENPDSAGIGRYDEARLVYTSALFQAQGEKKGGVRTIHLGIDVFLPPGTPVLAPLNGEVHSFRNNRKELDYGPTVILQHRPEGEEITFFSLYGHLNAASLNGIYRGKNIKKGEIIGWIGDFNENGGWPPHLHFQLITDMLGFKGDYPGAARHEDRKVWTALSPNPNSIAGIPEPELKPDAFSVSEIIRLRKKHILGALSISYRKPLKIVRGRGCYLYDHNGRAFLDAVNNVAHVGHEHPEVVNAVTKQVAVLNTNTRYLHDELVRYARRLAGLIPAPLRVCAIVNSGSEANDLALRMARCFTGAQDIIALEGAYHGHLSSLIDISDYKFSGPGGAGRPQHTQTAVMPDLFRGPYRYGDAAAGKKYAEHIREAVERIRKAGRRPAAFVAESLLSCGGQIVLPEGYLQEAYRIIREAGGVCIADEVQIGFGRVGENFWGFETQNVVPDIVTMGKPIGNGFPLAAVITTPEIAARFSSGMEYFNTFGGNPVACTAGQAVLDVIERERLQENAFLTGNRLKAGIERMKNTFPVIGDVRGMGLFLGIELVLDPASKKPASSHAAYAAERMREEGILISTDGPDRNVLKIKPPLVFSAKDAALFLRMFSRILAEDPMQI
jgi:4-aminobutyrate aminotransferase-like enzyme/Ser/Thr protein kinase RdoA (MazF antagonist)